MKKLLLLSMTFFTIALISAQDIIPTGSDIGYAITAVNGVDGATTNEVEVWGDINDPDTATAIVIPDIIQDGGVDYTVTAVGFQAFSAEAVGGVVPVRTITSIELPATVTNIKEDAFQETALEAVTFTTVSGITNIALRAFLNCASLTNVNDIISVLETTGGLGTNGNGVFNGCGITTLVTPSSLTSMGTSVFRGNADLTSVDMSASTSLTTINAQAFQACPLLTSVTFPSGNGVTSLGNGLFNGCIGLSSISIPGSVTSIGNNTFVGCTGLESIQVNNATPATINVANSFANIPNTAILYVPDAAAEVAYEADADWFSVFGDDASRIIIGTLSTTSVEQELGFSMYPNPTNGIVSITNNNGDDANVTVFDLNGRQLLSQAVNATQTEINITSLASGIYLFKVNVGDSEFTKRIVKQ